MTRLDEILKRCEAAPQGPLVLHEYNPGWVNIWPEGGRRHSGRPIKIASGVRIKTAEFFESAITDLPIVTKALQKAVEALEHNKQAGTDAIKRTSIQTLTEITAMLGEGK